MLAVLAITVIVFLGTLVAFLAWLNDRADQRHSDELDRLRDERQGLLQRIQAPEIAVVEHAQRHADPDPNPYPKSEAEQAADQGITQAMIAMVERMERQGIDMHMPQG